MELSLVLIVLGLLAGGILVGQSLIRTAQLRSATTDMSTYKNAIAAFKDKYSYLPGDIPNAVVIWGAAAGATTDGPDATCMALTTPSTTPVTCNGNGNGYIADLYVGAEAYEAARAWQMLANAGFIPSSYGGVSTSGNNFYGIPGSNVPASKVSKVAGWALRSLSLDLTGSANWFDQSPGNFLILGHNGDGTGGNSYNGTFPVLKTEEAHQIDSKMDDGKPGTGNITTYKGDGVINPGCTVDGTAATDYNLTNTMIVCALNIRLGL